jgi:hypothetical protein
MSCSKKRATKQISKSKEMMTGADQTLESRQTNRVCDHLGAKRAGFRRGFWCFAIKEKGV